MNHINVHICYPFWRRKKILTPVLHGQVVMYFSSFRYNVLFIVGFWKIYSRHLYTSEQVKMGQKMAINYIGAHPLVRSHLIHPCFRLKQYSSIEHIAPWSLDLMHISIFQSTIKYRFYSRSHTKMSKRNFRTFLSKFSQGGYAIGYSLYRVLSSKT